MDNEGNDSKARKIQEVANNLGWDSDISKLVERVKQIDKGLVQEDEFIYILNWSNRCSLVHKLDQFFIPPQAKKKYTIPDLLVIFDHNGKKTPFFIEIKTSKDNKLSWTENYYCGLENYARETGIPILIAWKWSNLDIWTLFELKHFKKDITNFKIGFEKAHFENLMSLLVGDYTIIPYNIGFHFKFKKQKLIKEEQDQSLWEAIFESIYITGESEEEIETVNSELFLFLFSLALEEEVSVEKDEYIIQSYRVRTDEFICAQSIPVRLAKLLSVDDNVNWLSKLKGQQFYIDYDKLYVSLSQCIEKHVIRNIFHTIPHTKL